MKIIRYTLLVGLISSSFFNGLSASVVDHIGRGAGNGALSLGCAYLAVSALFKPSSKKKAAMSISYRLFSGNGPKYTRLLASPELLNIAAFFSLMGCSCYGARKFWIAAREHFRAAYEEYKTASSSEENQELPEEPLVVIEPNAELPENTIELPENAELSESEISS